MTLQHHVSDDLLLSYEAGSLAEGWSLAVATHLAFCPECRDRSRAASDVGGALLDALPATDVDAGSFDRVMKKITAPRPPEKQSKQPQQAPGTIPEPLRSYVGGDIGSIKWRRLGLSARQLRIRTSDNETSVRLLRIPAGEPVPLHGHRGSELTVVLCGALIDENLVFRRGDIEQADESVEHQPTAGPGEDCICLAVTDAPLRFKSLMVRLAQPFLRI